MPSKGFRSDINGMRGICLLLVMAYHLQVRGAAGGFIGVDVFFVISGYLMTRIVCQDLAADRFSYWRFVAARAARIWSALAALVVVLFTLGSFWLPPFDMRTLAAQGMWALPMLSNLYFREHSGYNTQTADDLWLLHTWSLSIEWQFYVLYPLLLMAAHALSRRRVAAHAAAGLSMTLTAVVAVIAVLSMGYQWLLRSVDPDASFFLLSARAWELLAGGLVWLTTHNLYAVDHRWRIAAGYAGLALVLVSALAIALLHLRPVGLGAHLLLPVVGVALILWSDDRDNVVLGHAWLQSLGRWSYSVYLWHWPIIVAMRLTTWSVEFPYLTLLVAAVGSTLAGWLSYRYVERVVIRPRDASAWRMARRPILLMAAAAAVTVAVAASDGLAWRAPDSDAFYRSYETSIRPLLFPAQCSNFKKSQAQFKVCPIEREGGSRRVLVIGDSHAEHLWPWFAKHSQVAVDFFAASECPPVPRFERLQPGYHCRDYAAMAWEKARSQDYDTVIVSARWATVGLGGPPYCHEAANARCETVTGTTKQSLVLAELRAAIGRTLRAGKTVVVLDSAPESNFRVPPRLAREAFWHGEAVLSVDMRTLQAQTAWVDALFVSLRATPQFHLVSLRGELCDESACRVYDSTLQRPVYLDDSHFDPIWIAENAGFFASFVQAK